MINGTGKPQNSSYNLPLTAGSFALPRNISSVKNIDTVNLSPEAQQSLKIIAEGIDNLRQQEIKFSAMRLKAVKERLRMTTEILAHGNPQNLRGALEDVRAIGREISRMGRQIDYTVKRNEIGDRNYSGEYTALVKGFQSAVGSFNRLVSVFA